MEGIEGTLVGIISRWHPCKVTLLLGRVGYYTVSCEFRGKVFLSVESVQEECRDEIRKVGK